MTARPALDGPGAAVSIVVPTVGRPSLATLLEALEPRRGGPLAREVVLVDDRRRRSTPLLEAAPPPGLAARLRVVAGRGAGPAAAREVGWRATTAPWVAFLDDDVVPPPGWLAALLADLAGAGPDVAGVQGRIDVPVPAHRAPTDWERNVAGLAGAHWATADMAYRRAALVAVGGFDERLPRAYREDADLALRVRRAGWRLEVGRRRIQHPVRPAPALVSWALQRGNADDPFMAARHGRGWRRQADVPAGRRPRHLATTAAGASGLLLAAAGHRRVAALAGAAWAAGTAELAWARIAPGPRTPREVAAMVATSIAIPPAATSWWLRGRVGVRARLRRPGPEGRRPTATSIAPQPRSGWPYPDAVLFDRDGTLVEDVPYNGDPDRVVLRPGAAEAVARLRHHGIPVGIVTNQSGIARGLIDRAAAEATTARAAELVGGVDAVTLCPHGPDDRCECRKPAPGMVHDLAERLGVDVTRCVVIGDIGADVDAAHGAGARGILVPTPVTRPEEVHAAAEVAPDLLSAVDRVLGLTAAAGPGDVAGPGRSAGARATPASRAGEVPPCEPTSPRRPEVAA